MAYSCDEPGKEAISLSDPQHTYYPSHLDMQYRITNVFQPGDKITIAIGETA